MAKMNVQQKNYAKAKALVDTLKAQAKEIEQAYIKEHNIVNSDGTIPERIYCIEDEDVFNQANEVTAPAIDALGLYEAEKLLREAEDDLIRFGLSITPAKERKILSDRCFGRNGRYVHVDVREKVLDLAFKLDVSTIKSGAV